MGTLSRGFTIAVEYIYRKEEEEEGGMYIMLCVKIRREIERVGRVSPMRHESRAARKVRTRRADEISHCIFAIYLTTEEDFVDVYLTMSTVLRLQ